MSKDTDLTNLMDERLLTDIMQLHQTASDGIDAMREAVATWMRANGFATGHGDTLHDLLTELTWQVAELRAREALSNPIPGDTQ